MLPFLVNRLAQGAVILALVSFVSFAITAAAPGNAMQTFIDPNVPPSQLRAAEERLGIDRPAHVQYLRWLRGVVTGDWGRSIQLKASVLSLVWQRFQATLVLSAAALLIAVGAGVALGAFSASRAGTLADRAAIAVSLVGYSLPPFFLGIVLQVVFGLRLGWFPVTGMLPPGGGGFRDMLPHLVLPAVTLAAGIGALLARMTRATMMDVFGQDHVRTARAKGLVERAVTARHVFRNALLPIVTVVGLQIGYVLGGAVLVEQVFSWPGIGTLAVNAILARDFPLVQGVTLVVATAYVFANLVTDVAYVLVDPRVSYA